MLSPGGMPGHRGKCILARMTPTCPLGGGASGACQRSRRAPPRRGVCHVRVGSTRALGAGCALDRVGSLGWPGPGVESLDQIPHRVILVGPVRMGLCADDSRSPSRVVTGRDVRHGGRRVPIRCRRSVCVHSTGCVSKAEHSEAAGAAGAPAWPIISALASTPTEPFRQHGCGPAPLGLRTPLRGAWPCEAGRTGPVVRMGGH